MRRWIWLACFGFFTWSAAAQRGGKPGESADVPPTATLAPVALKDSLSKAQLERLLAEMHTGDEEARRMQVQLEKKRATLPKWFPASVWDDVEKQVKDIHYADVALPAYQKYVSAEHADAITLFFDGPTGQAIAAALNAKTEAAVTSAAPATAEAKAEETKANTEFTKLFLRRVSELGTFQQQSMGASLPAIRLGLPRAEEESLAAYDVKAREVLKATVAAHQAEILKAHAEAAK